MWGSQTDFFWSRLSEELRAEADTLISDLISIGQRVVSICKSSALVNDADVREISILIKQMRAALRLRRYFYSEPSVIHDEGTVLGFQPASQSDGDGQKPGDARSYYSNAHTNLLEILQLAEPQTASVFLSSEQAETVGKYRPNSAFIMM